MNDLFESSAGSVATPLSVSAFLRTGERPGKSGIALSQGFSALVSRFDRIERHETMRDLRDIPAPLLRALEPDFPDPWERCRAAELVDRCPARHLVNLLGRDLALKCADALRIESWRVA